MKYHMSSIGCTLYHESKESIQDLFCYRGQESSTCVLFCELYWCPLTTALCTLFRKWDLWFSVTFMKFCFYFAQRNQKIRGSKFNFSPLEVQGRESWWFSFSVKLPHLSRQVEMLSWLLFYKNQPARFIAFQHTE